MGEVNDGDLIGTDDDGRVGLVLSPATARLLFGVLERLDAYWRAAIDIPQPEGEDAVRILMLTAALGQATGLEVDFGGRMDDLIIAQLEARMAEDGDGQAGTPA